MVVSDFLSYTLLQSCEFKTRLLKYTILCNINSLNILHYDHFDYSLKFANKSCAQNNKKVFEKFVK